MNTIYTIRKIILLVLVLASSNLYSQRTWPQRAPSYPDTIYTPRFPQPYNAGFDVIITVDGNIIYGLVKEVDEVFIKYKRTDIPDGPVYTIRRNEVYAISYRNQVKEYITPIQQAMPDTIKPLPDMQPLDPMLPMTYNLPPAKKFNLRNDATARVGLGFIRGYTKVENADKLSSSSSFPLLVFAYDTRTKENLRIGLMLAFGSHKFSGESFSSYDSTIIKSNVKENIFSLMVYAKYALNASYANLRPYVLGGIGINSSNVNTDNLISFTNNSQTVKVNSGGRSTGLGILARIGADYYFNNQTGAFADVGVGSAVIQAGLIFKIK